MKYYALTLHANSPLSVRADHAPGGAASAQYIPGTALAGSLASAYLLFYPDNESGFHELFLNDKVWFPDLYPASFKKSKQFQNAVGSPVYPLPKTAQSCKRFPGFHATPDETDIDEARHGVRDSLLDWAMFAMADHAKIDPGSLLIPLEKHKYCPACAKLDLKRPMDNFTGYYRRLSPDGPMLKAKIDTRLQTHNGIDRRTGTVQEGILYNREVIEEDARFWGLLKLSDNLTQSFEEFIKKIANEQGGWLRVGRGRTRGLGKVGLQLETPDSLIGKGDFRKRLEDFNTLLQQQAESLKLPTSLFYFALTFHSPVILSDGWQGYYTGIYPDTLLEGDTLEKVLGLPENSLTLLCQFSSTRRVTGWNDLWGTPRANELAIDTGSVFLFACKQLLDDTLNDALYRLEEEGIGRRKVEGFGRICVSDQFHQEVELQ